MFGNWVIGLTKIKAVIKRDSTYRTYCMLVKASFRTYGARFFDLALQIFHPSWDDLNSLNEIIESKNQMSDWISEYSNVPRRFNFILLRYFIPFCRAICADDAWLNFVSIHSGALRVLQATGCPGTSKELIRTVEDRNVNTPGMSAVTQTTRQFFPLAPLGPGPTIIRLRLISHWAGRTYCFSSHPLRQ